MPVCTVFNFCVSIRFLDRFRQLSDHLLCEITLYHMVCSLSILTYYILVISHFSFEGGTLVLIASVSGHCLSFNYLT